MSKKEILGKAKQIYDENQWTVGYVTAAACLIGARLLWDRVLHVPDTGFSRIGYSEKRNALRWSDYDKPRFWGRGKKCDLQLDSYFDRADDIRDMAEKFMEIAERIDLKNGKIK